jgi:hypothetical protein
MWDKTLRLSVKFGRDARQRQAQIVEQQPREHDAGGGHDRPTHFEVRARLGGEAAGHAADADHPALMLGDALTAEKSLTGRTLDGRFPQGVIGTALIYQIHFLRRS